LNSGFRSEEIEMAEHEGDDDENKGASVNGYIILTRRLIGKRPL
jgi:hypothetical protein